MLVSTESGLTTVKMLPFPWIPCADALITVVSAASPVASPVSVMVEMPGLALDQVNATPLISFPYWSLPTALNGWVPPIKLRVALSHDEWSLGRSEGRARSELLVRWLHLKPMP